MRIWCNAQFVTIVITYNDYCTVHCIDRVCFYQVHHHVHWAGFDGVNSMHKLLDLFKGRSVGRVMRATSPNQLRKKQVGQNKCKCCNIFQGHILKLASFSEENII